MSRSKNAVLLAVALSVLLGVAAAALAFLRAPGGSTAASADVAGPGREMPPPAPDQQAPLQLRAPTTPELGSVATTSVAWPVVVELDLVRPADLPKADRVPPLGSGRTARLRGSVLDRGARGVAATLTFGAGPNRGRELVANDEGQFGASDLYPGLNVVEIRGPGIPGSVREVRLRQEQEEQPHVTYGMPGSLFGQVFAGEEPLEGAQVEVDGQLAQTNPEGVFHFPSLAGADSVPIVISKPGFATYTERVAVAAGRTVELGRYKFRLQPGVRLDVTIVDPIGGPGEAQVVLLPDPMHTQRTYPWERVSPRGLIPGSTTVFEDLPPGRVGVRVFHAGATAQPEHSVVTLHPGAPQSLEIHLKPAPLLMGRVVDANGKPVARAQVSLEAPDRVAVSQIYFAKLPVELEGHVLPTLAPQAQETRTDGDGRFQLTAWSELAPQRYLTATAPDGTAFAARIVGPQDEQVELELAPLPDPKGSLCIAFPGRHQGLPVVVVLNGHPGTEQVLASDQDLVLTELHEGIWRLRATWHGERVTPGRGYEELEVRAVTTRELRLPQGALSGQDEDTNLRARGG